MVDLHTYEIILFFAYTIPTAVSLVMGMLIIQCWYTYDELKKADKIPESMPRVAYDIEEIVTSLSLKTIFLYADLFILLFFRSGGDVIWYSPLFLGALVFFTRNIDTNPKSEGVRQLKKKLNDEQKAELRPVFRIFKFDLFHDLFTCLYPFIFLLSFFAAYSKGVI